MSDGDFEQEREALREEIRALRARVSQLEQQHVPDDHEMLLQRLRYEDGLARFSQALMADRPFEDAVETALSHLLNALQLSRVYVFENDQHPEDGLSCRQTYEVVASDVSAQINNPELQHLPYNTIPVAYELLSRGDFVYFDRDVPGSEKSRRLMEEQEIESMVQVPLYVAGAWYGFIGFDVCYPRQWRDADIRLLQTAAGLLSAAIEREHSRQATAQRERLALELENQRYMNEIKHQLIISLSHELRTPIAIALSSAELLRRYRDRMDAKQRDKHLSRIIDQLDHLTQIAEEAAALVEEKRGGEDEQTRYVPMTQVARERLDALQVTLGHAHHLVLVSIDAVEVVKGSRRLITRVLDSLLTNAVNYSKAGTQITLKLDYADDTLYLSVSDQGYGIPKEHLPYVTEPFYRAHMAEGVAGIGLGLSIVAAAAESVGGKLDIDSQPGEGTTVWLTLPVDPETGHIVVQQMRTLHGTNVTKTSGEA